MRDIVKEYQKKFRRNHQRARRYTALLLALALTTSLFVNWQLHGVGIAKTAEYLCGELEHEHTAACYEKQLVCGYEEGEPEDWNVTMTDDGMSFDDTFDMDDDASGVDADEPGIAAYSAEPEYIFVPHEHTDDCYQEVQELTCREEEHEHTDDCFDPEDGSLICDLFEHTHDDSCYTTTYELVCGLEEGELVEEVNPDYDPVALFEEPVAAKPVVVDPVIETPVHHHTDACYEEVLVCGLPEHHHTVNCLSDPLDGTQDEDDWLDKTGTALTGMWNEDLLTVAQSQLGYEQSEKNFKLDDADGTTVHYYTRYGAWYGNSYGSWDVMFLSYCLNYAGIPQSAIPQVSSVLSLHSQLRSVLYNEETGSGYAMDFDGDLPSDAAMPGDIVIYNGTVTKAVAVESQPLQVQDDSADADIALLSMDAAATTDTAPHIEEYTVDASTVGIVSDVDEDSGTLTVISGDVDGKVAKVTLNASQVTTLVSVANAQQADYGVATLDYKVGDGNTTVTGLPINSFIDFAQFYKMDGVVWKPSTEFTTDDQVMGKIDFSHVLKSSIDPTKRTVLIDLPAGMDCSAFEGNVYQTTDDGVPSGNFRYVKDADGNWHIALTFLEDYFTHAGNELGGSLQFYFKWDKNSDGSSDRTETIHLGNWSGTVTIKQGKKDDNTQTGSHYSINKSAGSISYNDAKDTAYIDYTVTLKVDEDATGPIDLTDQLSGKGWTYDKDSFKISAGSGSAPSFTSSVTDGTDGKTVFHLGADSENIPAGTYTITYRIKNPNVKNPNFTFENSVSNTIKVHDGSDNISSSTYTSTGTSTVNKAGEIVSGDGNTYVDWTVWLNSGDIVKNITNESSFTDTLPDDLELVGNVKIEQYHPDGTKASEFTGTVSGQKISATIPTGQYYYVITYRTKLKDGITTPIGGTTYNNTAESDGGIKGSDSSSVVLTNHAVEKTFCDQDLKQDADGNWVNLMNWQTTIDLTGSLKDYTYYDYSGTIWDTDRHADYTYMTDAQRAAIEVLDANGQPVSRDLYEIKPGSQSHNGVKTDLFEIHFTGDVQAPVTLKYQTSADMSKYNLGTSNISFTNHALLVDPNGSMDKDEATSNQFTYRHDAPDLIKKYGGDSSVTGNFGSITLNPGEDTIPWTIVVNDGKALHGKMVITDQIADGMTLVEDSVSVTVYGVLVHADIDYNSASRLLKITVPETSYVLNGTSCPVTIHYRTKLPDSFFKDDNVVSGFTNKASLEVEGTTTSSEFTQTVTRQVVGKSGKYDKQTGVLTYNIVLNPDSSTLFNGSPLTVNDVMDAGALAQYGVYLRSLNLFTAVRVPNADGTVTVEPGTFLYPLTEGSSPSVGTYTYDRASNTFVTQIEDSTAYVLVAEYVVPVLPTNDVTMHNTVTLTGSKTWSKTDENTKAEADAGGTTYYNRNNLTLIKHDAAQYNSLLSGASFLLQQLNADSSAWTDQATLETGSTGTSAVGKAMLEIRKNVLYKLTETSAPAGYIKDDTPYYFIAINEGQSYTPPDSIPGDSDYRPDLVVVYTSERSNDNATGYEYANIVIDRYNAKDTTTVTSGQIRVLKKWLDANGAEITDKVTLASMPQVKVTLTKWAKSTGYILCVQRGSDPEETLLSNIPDGGYILWSLSEQSVTALQGCLPSGVFITPTGTYHNGDWQQTYKVGPITSDVHLHQVPDVFYWNRGNPWGTEEGPNSSDAQPLVPTVIGTVTLNAANSWTAVWDDLETGSLSDIYYTITEETVDGYKTTYTVDDVSADSCPKIELQPNSGKLAVVNNQTDRTDSPGYELPSTGGAGTKLYTAGGGALMLAALVCGVCRKRRRERRAR